MVVPVAPVDTFLVNILFSGITMKFFSFPYGYAYSRLKVLKLKPSISSYSKSRTMACTRLLKYFVLQHSLMKTKHCKSLVRGVVKDFA